MHFAHEEHAVGVSLPQLGNHHERCVTREVDFLQSDHVHQLEGDASEVVVLQLLYREETGEEKRKNRVSCALE